ncbi:MAG TPA: GNAT family N-acetyltransferase, partial [Pyrinomonadaceae bacterium]|nr:GNAT family N-acetyltransferase [Pyrinomonadaceae bacterium]
SYHPDLMRKYFELEASGWKGRAGTAASYDENAARLHEDFARAAAERNALFIYELKLDGKTLAMQICLMYDSVGERKTVQWKIAYDEQYARYSPGNLLFREVLKGCLENDSPELDMLSPATANKKFWATGEREHVAFYIFRRGVIGAMLWKWKFSVISRLRKYKKKTPLKAASQ